MMLEELLNEYFDMFGENYPLMMTSQLSEREVISDIQSCIETGKPAKPVEYEDGLIY